MAQKYTVELLAKTDKAINEIEDLKNEIKGLQSQVSDGNKNTAEGLNTIGTAAKKTNRVLISVGNTLKAIGIGLILASLEKLREVFASNQKVIDFFNIAIESLTIAFNDLFNFLDSNVGTVVGYFKSIFDDPIQSIKDFGESLYQGIIVRIKQAVEAFGILGEAAIKFLSGDLAGSVLLAKNGFVELFDVVTGAENGLDTISNSIKSVTNSIVGYAKSTVQAAKGTVELNKAALTAEIQLQGLLEQYDRQAEKLRQVRDEERNTIQERIKANNDLNNVLDEQEAAMLKLVDIQIAAAQRQYDLNSNQENYNALLKITQERSAVLAQIEGFRSEQKSNDLALFREELELSMSLRDADFERMVANEEFNASMVGNDVARLERLKTLSEKESEIREQQLRDDLARTKLGTQAQVDAQNALFDFLQDNGNKQKQLDREIQEAKLATVSGALGGIAQLVGESSAFGKGIAVSQAIIDTYAGANKALAQGGIFGGVAAAGIIAAGLANVKTILSTEQPETPSFAGGGSANVSTAPVPTPPRFNIVGQSNISQLSETIAGQTQEPVKAYVVASDVTTAQSLERNIVSSASI